ncbi:MAG: hypothetical protein QOG20_1180 [Pseudonocardiales bacterium]|nr:hypothetical protein [Pseudonocardiales bacterium]
MSVTTDQVVHAPAKPAPAADMLALLDRLRVLTDAAGRPDLGERLLRARARVTDPLLRVVVTGQSGQGMSALVGTLVGVTAGTRPSASRADVTAAYDLLSENLSLIDVPGTSGEDSAGAAAALPVLAGADAVLFVSDASQEYTAPEIDYLAQVHALCPTVVGVITKIDAYPQWGDIQRANRGHLTAAGLDIPLLPVSSPMQQAALRSGDDALAVESGVPQLLGFLRERVVGAADAVVRAAVVNDVRVVTDHVALALNAELDVLNDPNREAELLDRLRAAQLSAERLRTRSANWQNTLGDGATELAVEVEHDLRHRLRVVVREAETDITRSDPAKRWDEFDTWLHGRIAECVRQNFVLAHSRSQQLAAQVAERFADGGTVAVPALNLDDTGSVLDPVMALEPLDSRKAGVVQRVISSMRGSYGGILMVGVMTSLAGLALVNPWSIGAGVLLGANTFREDHKSRTARRQAEAKTSVNRLMDDVIFQVGNESRFRLREVQRTLRDHFAALAGEMLRSADDALRSAQDAGRLHADRRDARIAEVQDSLGELRQLRVRAAGLLPAGQSAQR